MDMLCEFRAEVFGLFASAKVRGVQATDAGAEFVEAGVDRSPSPTEGRLGFAGGTVAVFGGHLRLEPSAPIAGEKFSG